MKLRIFKTILKISLFLGLDGFEERCKGYFSVKLHKFGFSQVR
jgi:hypothetical protein